MEQKTRYHVGKYKFYCKGKIIAGPKPYAFGIVFVLINTLAILEIAFPCTYFVQEGSPVPLILSVMLLIITNFFLFKTSLTDPGIIPSVPTPNIDEMRVNFTIMNSSIVKMKYCDTCNIIRPPRASHCDECDACIERLDHHCPYLGCCIGKRNYLSFILFIASITLFCILGTIICIAYIPLSLNKNSFEESMKSSPLIIPLVLIGLFFDLFLVLLCIYHVKIILQGRTTHEDIKETGYRIRPFDKISLTRNISSLLFIQKSKSRVKPGKLMIDAPFKYPLKRSRSESLNPNQKDHSEHEVSYVTTPPIADPNDCIQLRYSNCTPEEISEPGSSELSSSADQTEQRREGSNLYNYPCKVNYQKSIEEEVKTKLEQQKAYEVSDPLSETLVNSGQKPVYEDPSQEDVNINQYQEMGNISNRYITKSRSKVAPEPILTKPVKTAAYSPFEIGRSIDEDCAEPSDNIKSFSSEREDSTLVRSNSLKRSKSFHHKNDTNIEIGEDEETVHNPMVDFYHK